MLARSPPAASRDRILANCLPRVDAEKYVHHLILRRRQDSKRQGLATLGEALPRLRCQITQGNNLYRHLLSEVPLPSLRNLLKKLSERPTIKLDHLGPLRLALELTHGGVKARKRARLCVLSRRIDHTVMNERVSALAAARVLARSLSACCRALARVQRAKFILRSHPESCSRP